MIARSYVADFCAVNFALGEFFFFFNDTATTEIYTLSLHDALPISPSSRRPDSAPAAEDSTSRAGRAITDRKSTRLNSSHSQISYAVFCLKKKKKTMHAAYETNVNRHKIKVGTW